MRCASVHRLVLRAALLGKVGLPGVVAAYGWCRSRWFDAHHRGLWDEAVPGLLHCLLISGWPSWGPCHHRAAVCCLISAAVPLWFLEGPPVGGALQLPVTGCSRQGMCVPCWLGRGGPDGAASCVRWGVFPVSACGGLGPRGVPQTSHEGAVERTEDVVHKGCVRCLGFRLSADGGQQ